MPLVSVIIPVFNCVEYLAQCLDSACGQTLRDIEIVCVNDGSTDDSLAVIRRYAERDDRITIVDQPNRGLSGARNAGVAVAQGEYIQFLDSDDFLEGDALERLHARAVADDLDVVYFDAEAFFDDEGLEAEHAVYDSYYRREDRYPGVMPGERLLTEMAHNKEWRPSACLQLIRTRFYGQAGLSFYDGILHEDNLFSFRCALAAPKVAYLPSALYSRRVRAGSLVTSEKGVAHLRGFLITYLEMVRLVSGAPYEARTSDAVALLIEEVYQQGLKVLLGQPTQDWPAITKMDTTPEASLLSRHISRQGHEARKLRKATRERKKATKELKRTNKQLKAIKRSRLYRLVRRIQRLFRRS